MWKIIIFAICMLNVIAGNSNIEDLMGEWTPVALYPPIIFMPYCLKMKFVINSSNPQCECSDGKKTNLIETRGTGDLEKAPPAFGPMLFIEDENEVAASLNVNCTCGGEKYQYRTLAKSINDNYMVLYKTQNITKEDPNGAMIYAKRIPAYSELMEFMKNLKELSDRQGGILCCTEYEAAQKSFSHQKPIEKRE
ncbi:unnamed protein product [Arctia plantaginis]|uniref:Uncharacterized protein n=1 Tax=Arctia plantaginis TaxID=874455 RepID=A0A8S1ALY8_ARCPL|nr:unnamed protein product [Arctia plantaginis]